MSWPRLALDAENRKISGRKNSSAKNFRGLPPPLRVPHLTPADIWAKRMGNMSFAAWGNVGFGDYAAYSGREGAGLFGIRAANGAGSRNAMEKILDLNK